MRENDGKTLTTRQRKALEALLTCRTRAEACKRAGIGDETLRRYLRTPSFRAEYDERQAEILGEVTAISRRMLTDSLLTLEMIRDDPEVSPTTRTQASRSVMEYSLKIIEIYDLQRRVEAIEKSLDHGFEKGGER